MSSLRNELSTHQSIDIDKIPVTERRNPLTNDLDRSTPFEMLSLFRKSDAQMYDDLQPSTIVQLLQLQQDIASLLQHHNGVVIFSGCGTSGRIGLSLATQQNALSSHKSPQLFDSLLAGSNLALLIPQELGEDNPHQGVADLTALLGRHQIGQNPARRAIYIGITCGLSAPYVAGQLEFALRSPELFSCVACLGFNPKALARNVPIERWPFTFSQVLDALAAPHPEQRRLLLNPVIGPESVQGSSRMKGGTMTKILLEAVIQSARMQVNATTISDISSSATQSSLMQCIDTFRVFQEAMYSDSPFCTQLALLIASAGRSLRADPLHPTRSIGHVYYLAASASSGWLAMIDASECLCTYGAALEDVRCFLPGGWATLQSAELAETMQSGASENPLLRVSFDDLPWEALTADDTLIVVADAAAGHDATQQAVSRALSERLKRGFQLGYLSIVPLCEKKCGKDDAGDQGAMAAWIQRRKGEEEEAGRGGGFVVAEHAMVVSLEGVDGAAPVMFSDVLIKLALNAITTGAHVLKGKVFENQMIDLAVSNAKLFFRSIGIIASIARVTQRQARDALLQAIYQPCERGEAGVFGVEELLDVPVSDHIVQAQRSSQIIPMALLLALGLAKDTFQAKALLASQPIVNHHLNK